jgi:glutathione S-transferase
MPAKIFGRSSSHHTRVTRMFAEELGVETTLVIVGDLMSPSADDYGGNPALKMPTLRTSSGVWFGMLNVCRELVRQSEHSLRILWPEDARESLLANAQELVVQAMATEVTLILAKAAGAEDGAQLEKARTSLFGSLAWLEENVPLALAVLPERDLSYFEVTLFCFVTHLEFRGVLSTAPYAALNDFCARYGARPSAQATTYRFDS